MAATWAVQQQDQDWPALAVVVTGVPVAGGPVGLQIVWLLVVAAGLLLTRRYQPDP